jgi:hypothetical protein
MAVKFPLNVVSKVEVLSGKEGRDLKPFLLVSLPILSNTVLEREENFPNGI